MSDFSACPSCGHKPHGLTVAYMDVFGCGKCHTKYCHKCPHSNGGRQCPDCKSTDYKKVGRCYAK